MALDEATRHLVEAAARAATKPRHEMNPVEARQAMGVHWGTFKLTQEAFDQPPRDLALALRERDLPDHAVWLLRHGETRAIPMTGG